MVRASDVVTAVGGAAVLGVAVYYGMQLVKAQQKATLEVRVVDKSGNPINGATVSVDTQTKTTVNGSAVFELERGEYNVSVSMSGYHSYSTVISVEEGYRYTLNITLVSTQQQPSPPVYPPSPTQVYVKLKITVNGWVDFGSDVYRDTKWVPVKKPVRVLIEAYSNGTFADSEYTAADGTAELEVPAGTVELRIKDGTTLVASYTITADGDKEITIDLPSTYRFKERADPIFTEAGGGYNITLLEVPVPNHVIEIQVSHPKAGLVDYEKDPMEDAEMVVWEADTTDAQSPYDPAVKFRYTVHNIYGVRGSWLDNPKVVCRLGDFEASGSDSFLKLEGYRKAREHMQEVSRYGGAAGFYGEAGVSPTRAFIGVKGDGRYLYIRIVSKLGGYTQYILPIAK